VYRLVRKDAAAPPFAHESTTTSAQSNGTGNDGDAADDAVDVWRRTNFIVL
jgi:hypothetical protein